MGKYCRAPTPVLVETCSIQDPESTDKSSPWLTPKNSFLVEQLRYVFPQEKRLHILLWHSPIPYWAYMQIMPTPMAETNAVQWLESYWYENTRLSFPHWGGYKNTESSWWVENRFWSYLQQSLFLLLSSAHITSCSASPIYRSCRSTPTGEVFMPSLLRCGRFLCRLFGVQQSARRFRLGRLIRLFWWGLVEGSCLFAFWLLWEPLSSPQNPLWFAGWIFIVWPMRSRADVPSSPWVRISYEAGWFQDRSWVSPPYYRSYPFQPAPTHKA